MMAGYTTSREALVRRERVAVSNADVQATWQYHDGTKHSLVSVRTGHHFLDWPNQPIPYKIYTSLAPRPLPQELATTALPALDAIAEDVALPAGEQVPD